VIHVLTVHWRNAKWIDIQLGYLERNIDGPYQVWAALNGIDDPTLRARFHYAEDMEGSHAEKLNQLAEMAMRSATADPSDVLLFLDGDAFPVTPLDSWIADVLGHYRLAAVRRDENVGDCQPHPSFCITTAAFWGGLSGDWRPGGSWLDPEGQERTDVGGTLLHQLRDKGTEWLPLLRTNAVNPHPLWFGIYGHRIYHHGAGFRNLRRSRVDTSTTETNRPLSGLTLGQLRHALWRKPRRLLRLRPRVIREAAALTSTLRAQARQEEEMFAALSTNPRFYEALDGPADR
jgi:hypothetical protein